MRRVFEIDVLHCPRSPGSPADARFGAVAFVHRFGGYLDSQFHYH